jgi:hypothetical protein
MNAAKKESWKMANKTLKYFLENKRNISKTIDDDIFNRSPSYLFYVQNVL